MDKKDRIYLTSEELSNLSSKKIGEGYDAIVYHAPKGKLFKIYKTEKKQVDDDIKVKIYNHGDYKYFPGKKFFFRYVDKDDVAVYYKDAADRIIKRQESISKTNLPLAALYVDNKFVGYVLKKSNGMQLHIAWIFLGRRAKIKVLKELLNKVKELTDNYVYPTDIANSPLVGKHSNVLINIKLEPEIIDLDGISTTYREKEDASLLYDTMYSLNVLFLELLLGFSLFDDLDDINCKHIERMLLNSNVDEDTAHRLSILEGSYEDLNNLVLTVSKKK